MRNSGSSGLWPFLALIAVGSTVLTLSTNERTVARVGCFDNTDCGCSVDEGCPAGNSSEPGYCNESSMECICNIGFSGDFCCPNGCSGNGICDLGGNCSCDKGFTGEDCSMGIIGACCRGTECAETNASACNDGGGFFQGGGVNCSSNPCPTDCGFASAPECNGDCPAGERCEMVVFNASAGGGAQLEPSDCLCRPITGGCCLPSTGECTTNFNQSGCEGQGGTYQGDFTNCSAVDCPTDCGFASAPECNGDCPAGERCEMVVFNASAGGGAQLQPSDCLCRPITGGCCLPSTGECTTNFNQSSCEGQGGTYQGDFTNCSAVDCPRDCGFASAPECNGDCPAGERCEMVVFNAPAGGGAQLQPSDCLCRPITGGCCLPSTGECTTNFNQSSCEGVGGTYQGDDTNCSAVECPRSCGFSFAPECGGACPEGQQCLQSLDVAVEGTGGGAGFVENSQCQCFTPPGGECDPAEDTCQPDFVCDPSSEVCCNRICDGPGESCDSSGVCHVLAPAPAVSDTGLLVIIALLLVTGGVGFLRRRVRRQ